MQLVADSSALFLAPKWKENCLTINPICLSLVLVWLNLTSWLAWAPLLKNYMQCWLKKSRLTNLKRLMCSIIWLVALKLCFRRWLMMALKWSELIVEALAIPRLLCLSKFGVITRLSQLMREITPFWLSKISTILIRFLLRFKKEVLSIRSFNIFASLISWLLWRKRQTL